MIPEPDEARVAARLLVERTSARVFQRLTEAGVPGVLLKGPAISHWLYGSPAERHFVDTDLLVPRDDLPRVAALLGDVGYRAPLAEAAPSEQDGHSVTYQPDGGHPALFGEIDVHFSLPGVAVAPDALWEELASRTRTIELQGTPVRVLQDQPQALVIVLHAARDGSTNPQVLEDLRRCVAHLPAASWLGVHSLAKDLDAVPALARGLCLISAGAQVAAALGIGDETSLEMELRRARATPLAYGLAELMGTPWPRRLHLVARELWPTRAFLRHWSQSVRVRPGIGGLRMARLRYLTRQAPGAWRAWRAAAEAARHRKPG